MNLGDFNPALRGFLRALDDSQAVQQDTLLRSVILPNQECDFGRRHGFSRIRSAAEFKAAVPVRGYEDFRHDIERIARGESGVLTAEPVRRFFITSGSTGTPKYVPVTATFVREKAQAFQLFWAAASQAYPSADPRHFIFNFSDSGGPEQHTSAGIQCTSESAFWNACWRGAAAGMEGQSALSRDLTNISDPEVRYYAIARILLETEISMLMSLNPSTILLLFRAIQQNVSRLIRDVQCGGISEEMLFTKDVRDDIRHRFKGNKARAKQLEKVFAGLQTECATRIWPKLQLVVTWRSPMVRPYLEILQRYLGATPGRDYVNMASEGILAIPYRDEVSGGVLPIQTHFYEFIPEELADENDPETLLPHELEIGKSYVVVLSTSAGLYRYNIGDIVRVRQFMGTTPVIEFLHRAGRTCSLTGEKLTESQVADAVADAAKRAGLTIKAFTMCPTAHPFPHYLVLAEVEGLPSRRLLSRLLAQVDEQLAYRNVEYQSKRASQRLGAPELLVVPQGSYAAFRQQQILTGANDAQVKTACLSRDFEFPQRFRILERVSCELAA